MTAFFLPQFDDSNKHQIEIPGMDHNFCSGCGKWIITDWGIEYLEKAVLKASGKTQIELEKQLRAEKKLRESPCQN